MDNGQHRQWISRVTGGGDLALFLAIMAFLGALVFFLAVVMIPPATAASFADSLPTPRMQATAAAFVVEAASITPSPTLSPTPTATYTPTVTLPAPLPSPTAELGIEYIVQYGDTLYGLAQRYGVPMDAISAANNLTDLQTQFVVGLRLLIPVDPNKFPTGIIATPDEHGIIYITATPLPPQTVNGLRVDEFIIMPPEVVAKIKEIYATGQLLGRNPRAFSKLGDSTIENPHFLARFDQGTYNLGDYSYLEDVIDAYQGSFGRQGPTVRRGLHTWSVLDPMWAVGCPPGKHMLACEFEQHNPSILFIRMGSNDVGVPGSTESNLRRIVDYCIENGVIPILGTKADRFDGPYNTNNNIIREIAADYDLPLWDFDLLAGTIPGRGLGSDGVHMTTFFAHDWRLPNAYTTGNGVHNLTALMVLDRVWRIVQEQ